MKEIRRYRNTSVMVTYQMLLFLTLFTTTLSQRADFKIPENQKNRRFSWSTEAPLVRAINELAPKAIPHIDLLNQHMTRVEEAVLESLKTSRIDPDAVVQACNPMIKARYRSSIFRNYGARGFPEPAWNCGSDVSGVLLDNELPGYTLDDLYEAAFKRGQRIKERVTEIAGRLIDNFTRPEVPFNFTYNTVSAECALTPVCLNRVGEFWYQAIGIHSHGRDEHVADGKRNSIIEVFRVVDGKLGDNLLMRLPRYDNGSIERVFVDNTTTMIQTWRRTPNPSCFRLVPIEDNPAILDSLDSVDLSAQQAEDALTSSNLAILVLPLGLNLVPIALFADVGTTTMLLYTIMSDVLTVIPLAIKGVELILIRSRRFRTVVTRVLSPWFGNLTRPIASGGEIWAAECRVREEVGRTGTILVIIAVVFLFVGVGGEIIARWFVKRRVKKFGVEACWWNRSDGESGVERLSRESSLGLSNIDGMRDTVGVFGVEERYSDDFGYTSDKNGNGGRR